MLATKINIATGPNIFYISSSLHHQMIFTNLMIRSNAKQCEAWNITLNYYYKVLPVKNNLFLYPGNIYYPFLYSKFLFNIYNNPPYISNGDAIRSDTKWYEVWHDNTKPDNVVVKHHKIIIE